MMVSLIGPMKWLKGSSREFLPPSLPSSNSVGSIHSLPERSCFHTIIQLLAGSDLWGSLVAKANYYRELGEFYWFAIFLNAKWKVNVISPILYSYVSISINELELANNANPRMVVMLEVG